MPSVTANQSTYPTRETTPCDNSCNMQPASPNAPQHCRFEQGPPQRRRVNPESLAARLGPELVAEMEKHITPGSIEMPPFSVRRDIQIKFGIDRRHIYDFFHSRGLRCLNEKAMRNNYLETKSPRPTRSIAPSPSFPEPRKRRAAAAASAATSYLKRTHAPRKHKGRQKRLESPRSSASPDNIPHHDAPSLLEPEFDGDSLAADVTRELLLSSNASCFSSDISRAHFLGQFPVFSCEEPEEAESDLTPCHSVSSLLDLGSSISISTLSTSSSTSSTHSSSCEAADSRPRVLPLSSEERKAHYAWLDEIIGPASGIQESMGTYKAFMEHQRDVYYDRLRLMAEKPMKVAPSRATNEYLSWLGSAQPSQAGISPRESASAPSVATAPVFSLSACGSSPGCTNADACRYSSSRNQVLGVAFSIPQSARLNSRLPCSITDWTRHSRRRTFSATVDM
ncbi:hypothetical protein BJV78DRAFT_1161475 [Lactifluus subvellereus]|nr:hypothetical protein BJV78DRAFT_1161475 [Lactifluus subvellereus]